MDYRTTSLFSHVVTYTRVKILLTLLLLLLLPPLSSCERERDRENRDDVDEIPVDKVVG